MSDSALIAELAEIVRQVAMTPPEVAITAETRLAEDLGVDSFDMVGIVFSIQDRYGLKVREEDMPALATIAALASYIARRGKSEAA